jgi:hypothetical protein
MSWLPYWVYDALAANNIQVEYHGRRKRGRPTAMERRWVFSGWFYHRTERKRVVDGFHGPFKSRSAAEADAALRYGIADADGTPIRQNVVSIRKRAA